MPENAPHSPGLRDSVLRARDSISSQRAKLKAEHRRGSPGIQICNRFTDLLDAAITDIFESALADLFPGDPAIRTKVALVPHGGYARKEMAPYSDVDLMLLHKQGTISEVSGLSARLIQDISDVGVDLGFSLRTISQCCQMAQRDPIICSSLVEARFLAGSQKLFAKFSQRFARMVRSKASSLIKTIEEARREERSKYGEAVHLLEPNVKRSRGALRDIQFLRWIGYLRFGDAAPSYLYRAGHISKDDYNQIRKALDFLLRLRNDLHFEAGMARDTLHRSEQVRIAESMNYQGSESLLPVEEFMRDYFKHTESVRNVAADLADKARWRSPWHSSALGYMVSSRADSDTIVGPVHISTTPQGRERLASNLSSILRLMDVANRYDRRIDHPTWDAIRNAMATTENIEVDDEAIDRFMTLLSEPTRLGRYIRRLHQLGVLEKLVPGFDHARCLLQFNEYHKYTVDEHSIRAVEEATRFASDQDTVGRAYRKIENKALFHLALLVHDLGKGYQEDHSEVGARIAVKVAAHLRLNEEDSETLRFLVHRHLMLSHLAFRRDTSDEQLVLKHAVEVGSRQVLRMLFVLTCADFAAVGPDVLNDWKRDVLCRLYRRMANHLSSSDDSIAEATDRFEAMRRELLSKIRPSDSSAWIARHIEQLPGSYLEGPSSNQLMDDLRRLQCLEPESVMVWGRYIADRKVSEYSIGAFEGKVPGIFHRLAGTFSSLGLQTLTAEIHTLADGLILDRFYVADDDYSGCPPDGRFDMVSAAIEKALSSDEYVVPKFRRKWRAGLSGETASLTNLSAKVRVDNTSSDTSTIIDVFAHDRSGLLYAISRAIFDAGLSVNCAKIGTYLDQVVDVFYVTDGNNQKVTDDEQVQEIQNRLLAAIESVSSMPAGR